MEALVLYPKQYSCKYMFQMTDLARTKDPHVGFRGAMLKHTKRKSGMLTLESRLDMIDLRIE
jgi:hypothetical protein